MPISRARTIGRWAARVRGWGVDAGILPYRSEGWTAQRWAIDYRSRRLDYYASLEEAPRYFVAAGFAAFEGDRPSVLDLGCGRGLLRLHLHAHQFRRYIGVDISPTAVEQAGPLADEKTEFVVGDVAQMDLPDCDVIVLNEVLYGLPEPMRFLDHLASNMRPGGRLITSMWRHPGDRQLWREVDARFDPVELADIHVQATTSTSRGWRVGYHRHRHG